jgi:hypothetical protein
MFFEIKKVNPDHSIDTLYAEANQQVEVENWCKENIEPNAVYFVVEKLQINSGPTGSALEFFIPITEITKVDDRHEYK